MMIDADPGEDRATVQPKYLDFNASQRDHADMLQQVHLINLDRSSERLVKFKKRNSHLEHVVRVSAIDGAALDREKLVQDGLISADLSYGDGTLGCALSHVMLWKKAVAENRIITIFEDDVVSAKNFSIESMRVASILPEGWELIQWGWKFQPSYCWVNFGLLRAEMRFYHSDLNVENAEFQNGHFSTTPFRLAHSFGLQAYSVTPKGAEALIKCCVPLRRRKVSFAGRGIVIENVTSDSGMNAAYPAMQAFICIPPLVIQDETLASDRISADNAPPTTHGQGA